MSEIIIGLVAIVAIAFIFETVKRSTGTRPPGEDDDEYVSADEAGPTQSGRFRAQRVKAAIHQARQSPKDPKDKGKGKEQVRANQLKPDPKNLQRRDSTHSSLAHEQVGDESSETELPDPFEIDIREDD